MPATPVIVGGLVLRQVLFRGRETLHYLQLQLRGTDVHAQVGADGEAVVLGSTRVVVLLGGDAQRHFEIFAVVTERHTVTVEISLYMGPRIVALGGVVVILVVLDRLDEVRDLTGCIEDLEEQGAVLQLGDD